MSEREKPSFDFKVKNTLQEVQPMKTTFLKKSPTQTGKGHPLFAVWLVASCAWMLAGDLTAQSFTTLHSLSCFGNASDGANPEGGLLLSGNSLYGTTTGGGDAGNGTVFALNADGTGFRNLYSFSAFDGYNADFKGTNSDGARPYAGLNLLG